MPPSRTAQSASSSEFPLDAGCIESLLAIGAQNRVRTNEYLLDDRASVFHVWCWLDADWAPRRQVYATGALSTKRNGLGGGAPIHAP